MSVPVRDQRQIRLKTVFHNPNRSGRSRCAEEQAPTVTGRGEAPGSWGRSVPVGVADQLVDDQDGVLDPDAAQSAQQAANVSADSVGGVWRPG